MKTIVKIEQENPQYMMCSLVNILGILATLYTNSIF